MWQCRWRSVIQASKPDGVDIEEDLTMAREITHRVDRETGHVVQLVSPERLREILVADGESLARPKDFGPNDEWDIGEED